MTAAIAPDPQQRAPILGGLRQSQRFRSVTDFLAIDGQNNVLGPEPCLRRQRKRVEVEHDRPLHLTRDF